jgi:hypothetical protein
VTNRIGDGTSIARGEYQPGSPIAVVAPPPTSPFPIPPQLASIAGILAVVIPAVALIIPAPWATPLVILGFVAAFLAGAPSPVPQVLEGRRIVGPAAVPILGAVATFAGTSAEQVSDVRAKFAIQLAGLVAAWLAGKAFPTATK